MNTLGILGRASSLFSEDLARHSNLLFEALENKRVMVVGGAGSIGSAFVKGICRFRPAGIVAVDIDENGLVELVRDLRSEGLDQVTKFSFFSIDSCSNEFLNLSSRLRGSCDFVVNFSALKHVRSERDPLTLSRMVTVNIENAVNLRRLSCELGAQKYFCVSTDKAFQPVNMMGASKRLMEMFVLGLDLPVPASTARFANVAFSNGSLLHGISNRISKRQPIAVPGDIQRYFMSPEEAAELCVLSLVAGADREIFVPKESPNFNLVSLVSLVKKILNIQGLTPVEISTEEDARRAISHLELEKFWPVLITQSDTTGEKVFENFFRGDEIIDKNSFGSIIKILDNSEVSFAKYQSFLDEVKKWRAMGMEDKSTLVNIFKRYIPEFEHNELGKNLDDKM